MSVSYALRVLSVNEPNGCLQLCLDRIVPFHLKKRGLGIFLLGLYVDSLPELYSKKSSYIYASYGKLCIAG